MAYVINKLRDATQKQNEMKQGSSAVTPSTGVGAAPNRTSSFASPMDVINANKGNQNQAVTNRIVGKVGENFSNISKNDNTAFGEVTGSEAYKGYAPINETTTDKALQFGSTIATPTIAPKTFSNNLETPFQAGLAPGLKDYSVAPMVKQQGQQYTAGMGNLDTILSGRSGALAKGINAETQGRSNLINQRQNELSGLGYAGSPYTGEEDYSKLYNESVANKLGTIYGNTRTAAQAEIARREAARIASLPPIAELPPTPNMAPNPNVGSDTITFTDYNEPTVNDLGKSSFTPPPISAPAQPTVAKNFATGPMTSGTGVGDLNIPGLPTTKKQSSETTTGGTSTKTNKPVTINPATVDINTSGNTSTKNSKSGKTSKLLKSLLSGGLL